MTHVHSREEVTEVMLASPVDCSSPALLCRFSNYLVEYFEGKVLLRFKRLDSLMVIDTR